MTGPTILSAGGPPRIARNKTISLLRRRSCRGAGGTDFYRRSLLIPDPQGLRISEEAELDEGRAVEDLYKNALDLVREEFEKRTWQAFWRTAIEGQAPAIIAEDLGVTPAAVRQAKLASSLLQRDILGESLKSPGNSGME